MPATVVKSIGSAVGRDYATIAAWEAALPDLTVSDTIQIGELYNDNGVGNPATADANPLINVTGTTATNYVVLRAATGHSYKPNTHGGAWIRNAGVVIRLTSPFTRLQGIGFASTVANATTVDVVRIIGSNCWIHGCMAEMTSGSSTTNVGFNDLSSGGTIFTSCIARGTQGAGLSVGFSATAAGDLLLNCTSRTIRRTAGSNGTGFLVGGQFTAAAIHNAIGADCGLVDFNVSGLSTISHCISSDATATGTGSKTGFDGDHLFRSSTNNQPIYNFAGFNAGMDPTSLWPDGVPLDFNVVLHNLDGNGFEIGPYNSDNEAIGSPAVTVAIAPPFATLLVAGASSPAVVSPIAPPVSPIAIAGLASPAVVSEIAAPVSLLLVAGISAPAVVVDVAPDVGAALAGVVASPAVLVLAAPGVSKQLAAQLAAPAVLELVAPTVAFSAQGAGLPFDAFVVRELASDVVRSSQVALAARVELELAAPVARSREMTLSVLLQRNPSGPVRVLR